MSSLDRQAWLLLANEYERRRRQHRNNAYFFGLCGLVMVIIVTITHNWWWLIMATLWVLTSAASAWLAVDDVQRRDAARLMYGRAR